jgi:diacylglycerol kinase family enzyme
VQLLPGWRAAARGRPFPLIGVLKLGTGNAWARVSGADRYFSLVPMLPLLPRSLPGQTFDLLEVDGSLCHFAGAGWDAQVLIDYQRNLDKRSSQLIGSRLASRFHRGLTGYFYATWRLTLPGEIDRTRRFGRTAALIESTAPLAFRVDSRGEARPVEAAAGEHPRLYDGPFGVIGMATEPELGFGLRAFPFARMKPGFMHLRIFAGGVLSAFRHPVRLWRGDLPPPPGIEDFLVSRARLRFSRPVAIQIAGDAREERASVEIGVAPDRVVLVDWREAARSVSSRKA